MAPENKRAAKRSTRATWVATFLMSGFMLLATSAVAADDSGRQVDANLRAADDAQTVQFVLTLGLRNQDQLQQELKDMYDRSSPHYHHFLSSADFIAKYAPSKDNYAALENYATKHGLKVVGEHASRTMVKVEGSAAAIRDLFKSSMYWRQDKQGKQYLASDLEPTVPSELSSLGGSVTGLNQKPLRSFVQRAQRAQSAQTAGRAAISTSGSGYGGSWLPHDIRTAYDVIGIENGGQPVALVEFSSANYSDAAVYASAFGLNNPVLTQIPIDGGTTDTSGAVEVMLDIEMLMAVSNTTNIFVYTSPNTSTGSLDLFTQIAEDDQVGQVSTSWGLCETERGQTAANQENTIFTQMAAEGIAVFAASGDDGAYDCGNAHPGWAEVDDPAAQPYVTGVGGTSLIASNVQTYLAETVWVVRPGSDTSLISGGGSGGGQSMYWPIPSYQTGVTPQVNPSYGYLQFSKIWRNVPDVALMADPDPGFYIYCSACTYDGGAGWGQWGGTSAATPLWAGLWSLINQGLTVKNGTSTRAGFANPTLYAIGENASEYAQAFQDVTIGDNNYMYATPGYDDATGWGSYNGAALYEQIVGPSNRKSLSITPVLNFLMKAGN
jgi:kumamolisin